MWRKKRWGIVLVLGIVALLFGILSGVVLAQNESTGDSSGKTLLARVAAILGIEQQEVEDAFTQAQKEMRDEALDNQLKSLVEKGKMTQEQAGQYKQWWQSKPDIPGLEPRSYKGLPGGFYGPRSFHGWYKPFGPSKIHIISVKPSSM